MTDQLAILLIEDNPADARLVEEQFRDFGKDRFHLLTEPDLARGLDTLGKGHADLILLDLSLPDSSGLDALKTILNAARDIPVIVFTGLDSNETAEEAVRLGAQDFILKDALNSGTFVRAIFLAVERHRLLQERQHHILQLKEANTLKSRFLAGVSHELRTPLNAILGYSQIMQQQLHGPMEHKKYADYIDMIHQSGAHLSCLVNDLLDLSRASVGKLTLREKTVDIVCLAGRAIHYLQQHALDKDVALCVDPLCGQMLVLGDETRLFQVLLNLLSNAIKFSRMGGCVSVEIFTDAEGQTVIRIRDEGIGIPQEDLDMVLVPFNRGNPHIAHEGDGSGLGLPMAKSLVELHGGRLTLESEAGKGTSVEVTLPPNRHLAASTAAYSPYAEYAAAQ